MARIQALLDAEIGRRLAGGPPLRGVQLVELTRRLQVHAKQHEANRCAAP